mmetsp:Transcript_12920/g.17669  ORF Transcript_12920/g.17669 Transcript_12920/m.17669 type:complete len:112 (+) Transcript_12920:183-518(+)|eukprot:CAMPEP_0196585432 /NCGR_PEP_ID=MMETSP1081-20130531/50624_1 /TAXON_ID=36882 /ORGANISM="Pyramimonas amylifera, Strain CCMP720" /LENGTH=111 /DNA_ID=CAMNT_0041906969 /DNA_START=175 /DNA_END=510 /DNA_ORIENTATION=+
MGCGPSITFPCQHASDDNENRRSEPTKGALSGHDSKGVRGAMEEVRAVAFEAINVSTLAIDTMVKIHEAEIQYIDALMANDAQKPTLARLSTKGTRVSYEEEQAKPWIQNM